MSAAIFFTRSGPGVLHLPDGVPSLRLPILTLNLDIANVNYRVFERRKIVAPAWLFEDWRTWHGVETTRTRHGDEYITIPVIPSTPPDAGGDYRLGIRTRGRRNPL